MTLRTDMLSKHYHQSKQHARIELYIYFTIMDVIKKKQKKILVLLTILFRSII